MKVKKKVLMSAKKLRNTIRIKAYMLKKLKLMSRSLWKRVKIYFNNLSLIPICVRCLFHTYSPNKTAIYSNSTKIFVLCFTNLKEYSFSFVRVLFVLKTGISGTIIITLTTFKNCIIKYLRRSYRTLIFSIILSRNLLELKF